MKIWNVSIMIEETPENVGIAATEEKAVAMCKRLEENGFVAGYKCFDADCLVLDDERIQF